MRIHGYCDTCHRFKQVQVSGHGMAMLAAHGVPHGECSDCQDDAEFQRGVKVKHRNTGLVGVCTERAMNGNVAVLWEDYPRAERTMTRLLVRS